MDFLYLLLFLLLGSNASSNKVKGLTAEKIVGGALARKKDFKYVAALKYKLPGSDNDQTPCAASIVSNIFMVTVAHCFFNKTNNQWIHRLFYVAMGVNNLNKPNAFTRYIIVDTVTIPAIYNPMHADDYSKQGNLAIIKLDESLGLEQYEPSFSTLMLRQQVRNYYGEYTVAGYGYHKIEFVMEQMNGVILFRRTGESDGKLRHAKVTLMNDTYCSYKLAHELAPGNMCAEAVRFRSQKPTGICDFDSGAPLVSYGKYLDGIAVMGMRPCDENLLPGIYLDVGYYSPFILDVMGNIRTKDMIIMQLQDKPSGEWVFEPI